MIRIEKCTFFFIQSVVRSGFGAECVCLVFARTSVLLPFMRVAVQVGRGSLLWPGIVKWSFLQFDEYSCTFYFTVD